LDDGFDHGVEHVAVVDTMDVLQEELVQVCLDADDPEDMVDCRCGGEEDLERETGRAGHVGVERDDILHANDLLDRVRHADVVQVRTDARAKGTLIFKKEYIFSS